VSLLLLRLRGEPDGAPAYVIDIRTVDGRKVWGGRASATTQGDVLTQAEVPMQRLPADDYIVSLAAIDSAGQSVEVNRYFFRVVPR
jgi:hypothetical protein